MKIRLIAAACLAGGNVAASEISVSTSAALRHAIEFAHAGDTIIVADGDYPITTSILASTPGSSAQPILVRAAHRWRARLRSTAQVAITIGAPFWRFQDLEITGACPDDTDCEHAFHIVGRATDTVISGNRLIDFNAQVKANSDDAHDMPERGLIENNQLFNTHPRHTSNPVALLDLDHASHWIIRGNAIWDFAKDGGNGVAYGAFVKGGAVAPVMERNWVACAWRLPATGSQVGLSFGGGGMDPALCAPHWDAASGMHPEVSGGIMRNNIIVACSDAGIYLNKATGTQLLFNTLVRTQGIDARFPATHVHAHGNVLSNILHARDGAQVEANANVQDLLSDDDFGAWYVSADLGDLRLKRGAPEPLTGAGGLAPVSDDFCGRPRHAPLDAGALQSSLGSCETQPKN